MGKSVFWRKGLQAALFLSGVLSSGVFLLAGPLDHFTTLSSAGQKKLQNTIKQSKTKVPVSPYEINFDASTSKQFQVHAELELWGRNHNLLLVADSPMRNLQDGLAHVISAQGLEFILKMPKSGRAWLYLDLVTYRPLGNYQFSRVRWLDVYANGELVEILYQGGGRFLKSPHRIAIDREHARDGQIRIKLRPSPGDGSWAIWDAFVSRYAE